MVIGSSDRIQLQVLLPSDEPLLGQLLLDVRVYLSCPAPSVVAPQAPWNWQDPEVLSQPVSQADL